MSNILTARSVGGFFKECVDQVVKAQELEASELALSYLVALLSELASGEQDKEDVLDPIRTTLVELIIAAQQAQGPARAGCWRKVGDTALMSTGMYREALLSRGIPLDYYYSIGGTAYQTAAHLHRFLGSRPMDELCQELADKLPGLSDVLDEVMALTYEHGATGLVRLLYRWKRTKSSWALRHLAQRGLWPVDPRH